MTDLVNPNEIEALVGRLRHATVHYARASSVDQQVYILHSQQCKDSTPDLRDCPYSVALDRGIVHALPWNVWRRAQDRPVRIQVRDGWLMPDLMAMRGQE